MHKVRVMDADKEHRFRKKIRRKKEKSIKIADGLFDIGLRKGLIEKNEDEYYFVGDYEELIAFKSQKLSRSFEWLYWIN